MTYLALANGVTYFLYSTPNMFPGIFDPISNLLPLDDPLVQDISAVGEKLTKIGPFLLLCTLMPDSLKLQKNVSFISGDSDMACCRGLLMETIIVLGQAYLAIHISYNKAHQGCESMLQSPLDLWNQFGPLQEDYYLGKKAGLVDKLQKLQEGGKLLIEKAQAARTGK